MAKAFEAHAMVRLGDAQSSYEWIRRRCEACDGKLVRDCLRLLVLMRGSGRQKYTENLMAYDIQNGYLRMAAVGSQQRCPDRRRRGVGNFYCPVAVADFRLPGRHVLVWNFTLDLRVCAVHVFAFSFRSIVAH